jgi:hypothetical protein
LTLRGRRRDPGPEPLPIGPERRSGRLRIFDAGQAFASILDYPNAHFVRSLVNELQPVSPFDLPQRPGRQPGACLHAALLEAAPGTFGASEDWTTTGVGLVQPGTIDFAGSPVCLRSAPGHPLADEDGRVRLPGCRGIQQLLTGDLANLPAGAPIEFLFEKGYEPRIDGCVLGVSNPGDAGSRGVAIAGHPVVARRVVAGLHFDPQDVAGTTQDTSAIVHRTCGRASSDASTTRIGAPHYASGSQLRLFAQTAWHPLAGCKTAAEAHDPSDAVRRCDFSNRNFEQEFLAGTAQIFRSEIAAVSWNFLMLLVLTSCDPARAGDDLSAADCFDPRPASNAAWTPDRCSLAAPQLCRNVQVSSSSRSTRTATASLTSSTSSAWRSTSSRAATRTR